MASKIQKFLVGAALALFLLPLPACGQSLKAAPPLSTPKTAQTIRPPVVLHPPALPLYCKVGRGSALFGRDWYDFGETSFLLYRGTTSNIKILSASGQEMMLQVFFDPGGQKLVFCPIIDTLPGERIACTSLYTVEDDLEPGIKRTFDIPAALRGGSITCATKREHLRPLTTPAN